MAVKQRQVSLTALLSCSSSNDGNTQSGSNPNTLPSNDSAPPAAKKAKHRESGFDQAWKDEFMWVHVDEDVEAPGMYCRLCRKHNQTTKKMIWIEIPCRLFRKDKLVQHQRFYKIFNAIAPTYAK